MDFSNGQDSCGHDGFYSGVGHYSREAEEIRYVLVCDECGTEMHEVSTESYAPDPVLDA